MKIGMSCKGKEDISSSLLELNLWGEGRERGEKERESFWGDGDTFFLGNKGSGKERGLGHVRIKVPKCEKPGQKPW